MTLTLLQYNPLIFDQQVILSKRLLFLSLLQSDKIQISLSHLLKVSSNASLILCNRIINWFQRYKCTITQNVNNSLSKRKIFLQDLKLKVYHEEIKMRNMVTNIILHPVVPHIVIFTVKEIILHMVMYNSLLRTSNIP